jgi:hypothetical protein
MRPWARIEAVFVRALTVDSVDVVALLGVWQGFRIGPLRALAAASRSWVNLIDVGFW